MVDLVFDLVLNCFLITAIKDNLSKILLSLTLKIYTNLTKQDSNVLLDSLDNQKIAV